ncbi:MAG: DNA replication/repair protein RecF [Gammaproteobacteria bacterium]|nr:DNA replication/repair protein RecF [Gammaproteobacteria bacterium]
MILTQAGISGFRNLADVTLVPAPTFNILHGGNGAGKSSILEAFHLLSTGHSYRTRKIKELITLGQSELTVTAQLLNPTSEASHRAGIRKSRNGETELKLDFEPLNSAAEMARTLPVKALFPDSHRLMQDGPAIRRQFLDWGVFHVEPGFFQSWKSYRRALDQRNQGLRAQLPDSEITAWHPELAQAGESITRNRLDYVAALSPRLQHYLSLFDIDVEIELGYRPGWTDEIPLLEKLEQSLDQCRRFRTTTVGPHRAELTINLEQMPARQILSRGQQKLVVYALHFAQLELFSSASQSRAVVLCDDLPAELDEDHLQRVLACLESMQLQTFITSNRPLNCPEFTGLKSFHVERGLVREVV